MELNPAQRTALAQLLASLLAEQPAPALSAPAPEKPRSSYTPKEIAARNNYCVSYVYQQIKRGKLKASRTGGNGQYRITPEAEREWVES